MYDIQYTYYLTYIFYMQYIYIYVLWSDVIEVPVEVVDDTATPWNAVLPPKKPLRFTNFHLDVLQKLPARNLPYCEPNKQDTRIPDP